MFKFTVVRVPTNPKSSHRASFYGLERGAATQVWKAFGRYPPSTEVLAWLVGMMRQKPGNWREHQRRYLAPSQTKAPSAQVLGGRCLMREPSSYPQGPDPHSGKAEHCVLFPGAETDVRAPPKTSSCEQRHKGEHVRDSYCVPDRGLFIPSFTVSFNPYTNRKIRIIIPIYQTISLRHREVKYLAQGHTAPACQRQVQELPFPLKLRRLFLVGLQGLVSVRQ